jgi:hypothetical protein
MSDGTEADQPRPSRVREIIATLVVVLLVIAVWAIIEYRMQPPPPPHPVQATDH